MASINDEAATVMQLSKHPLSTIELLDLTELKLKKGQSFVVRVLQARLEGEELSSVIGRISDIIEEQELARKREQKE